MTKKGSVAAKTAALKGRTFTREFKLKVICEIESARLSRKWPRDFQLSDNTISKWRRELWQYKERTFAGRGNAYTDETRINELERMVAPLSADWGLKLTIASQGHLQPDPSYWSKPRQSPDGMNAAQ